MIIRTRYEHEGTRTGVKFPTPSQTFQSEKNDTMIEAYLRKYRATGFFGDPQRKAAAMFGDFSGLEDFQTIQNKMARIREHFDALPSTTRRFFGDDPANYVAFVTNPQNLQKSIDMGLLAKEDNNEKAFEAPAASPQPQPQQPAQVEPAAESK